uniref:RdRp n=1 Tax=Nebalia bipes mitovirus 1 TaxID=2950721 RepID=A0A9N6YIZ6_9VIRU|nr:TPA_asm: RdRp [Nebalia bipes mitovirus 1]
MYHETQRLWHRTGLRSLKKVKGFPIKGPSYYLNPHHGGSQWIVRGPHGKGFLAILGDLASVVSYPKIIENLDYIGTWVRNQPYVKNQSEYSLAYYIRAFFNNGTDTLHKLHDILQSNPKLLKWGYPTLGRLAHFNEVGGKKRYIALGNWIFQGTLRPLHDILIMYLRRIRSDCTYNQSQVFSFYKDIIDKEIKDFYSLDLSRATDRLPLKLQAGVLRALTGRNLLAEAWFFVISRITFSTRVGGRLTTIRYRVGQGIGLYSSWAILALTNHVVIRLAGIKVGKSGFKEYLVLGDDVVIADKQVALIYQTMIRMMGVGISTHKSIVPSRKVGLEFASKLINWNGDISPLPIVLLTKKGIVSKIQFLSQVVERIVTGPIRNSPTLEILLDGVFGPRLRGKLGDLWARHFFFSLWRKIRKVEIEKGLLPEFFRIANKQSEISLVGDLSAMYSRLKLDTFQIALGKLELEKVRLFDKITKLLFKSISKDTTSKVIGLLRSLGGERGLSQSERAQLGVLISQYIKGPSRYYLVELASLLESRNPEIGPSPEGRFPNTVKHENYSVLDSVLSRRELELIDQILRFGWGPISLNRTFWFENLRINPPKRIDSKTSRIRSRRVYIIAQALGFNPKVSAKV